MACKKNARNLQVAKKRLWDDEESVGVETDFFLSSSSDDEGLDLNEEIRKLRSTGMLKRQEDILRRIKKVIFKEPETTIETLFQSGLVPRFVDFLNRDDSWQLQLYSTMILRNLATGTSEQAQVLIECQVVPKLVRLLSAKDEDIKNEALYALGEIAYDHTECRKHVLDHGVLTAVLEILETTQVISTVQAATSCLSILCKGDLPDESKVLVKLHNLLHETNSKILEQACIGVAYYVHNVRGNAQKLIIRAVMELGMLKRLVQLTMHPLSSIVQSVLTALGQVSLDETLVSKLVDCSVLPKLLHALETGLPSMRGKACQIITNITAGTRGHVHAVFEEFIFPSLIGILDSKQSKLKKAAAEAIYNTSRKGTPEHIQGLVQMGCIESLCDLLRTKDKDILRLVLNTLYNILVIEEEYEDRQKSVEKVRKKSGVAMLQQLVHHEDMDISGTVGAMLQRFFSNGEMLQTARESSDEGYNLVLQVEGESREYSFLGNSSIFDLI